MLTRRLAALLLLCLLVQPARAQQPIVIVAAESFYGDVARQIAGNAASVESILSNPSQDPHMFEASPSVARLLASASIVVQNGADYDPWLTRLLGSTRAPGRTVIVVAALVHRKPGDNPHIWYDPSTMPTYAKALAAALGERDPPNKDAVAQRLRDFLASLDPIASRIAAIKARFSGTPATATEPVFGYMATALGLRMRNERFQLAIMNGTEPRMSDMNAFEDDLRRRQVRLLFYNSQATTPMTQRLLDIARQANIPVVGVTETMPAGKACQEWLSDALNATEQALSQAPP